MNELIRIDNDNKVSGRELHDFLEVGRDFTNWMKQMIGYGFNEHADYEVYAKNGENPSGGRPSVDYSMTIDMAKEICMIQRTDKGKQARQYFIECEKRLKAVNSPHDSYMISDPVERALKWIEEEKVRQYQAKQLLEQKPKVEFFDAVAESKDAIEIASVAKVLNVPGVGRNKLFEFLRNHKVLMRNNQPYQKYVDCGYFRIIEQKYERPNGDTCINIKTLVYQKGVKYIQELLKNAHM